MNAVGCRCTDAAPCSSAQVLPTPPDTACVWVMGNGAIMSADNTFSDWFAYPVREIANRYLHSLVADPKALIK